MSKLKISVSNFERTFVGISALFSGLIILYLSINGPLLLNRIVYRTPPTGIFQIQGQDFVNIALISPLLLIGGVLLLLSKGIYKYFLILTPLTVIYYVISYTIGCEWSNSLYKGNSEKYSYWFLFVLISALIIMFYTLQDFKDDCMEFKKSKLTIYTCVLSLFALMFAMMWLKEVNQVIFTGTARAYKEAPTAFWLVRFFDLGFSIPLLLLSTYLLWTRPLSSFSIQMLCYGFFITMAVSVNSMGIMMLIKNDPTASVVQQCFFILLGIIVLLGYLFIHKSRKKEEKIN